MSNIYDSAHEIERELRELPEFLALKEARNAVDSNEESKALFAEFQEFQQILQQKQMSGEEFSEEDTKKAGEISGKVQQDTLINDLMMKEQSFSLIVNDLNGIIMTPVRELYQN